MQVVNHIIEFFIRSPYPYITIQRKLPYIHKRDLNIMIIKRATLYIKRRRYIQVPMIILTFTDFDDRHILEVIQEASEAATLIPLIIWFINEF